MFLGQKTRQRFRTAMAACVGYLFVAAGLAIAFPRPGQTFASSSLWWLTAIPVGLVSYAALELFGTWFLDLAFWRRMPSWARVCTLVALICVGAVTGYAISHFAGVHGAL